MPANLAGKNPRGQTNESSNQGGGKDRGFGEGNQHGYGNNRGQDAGQGQGESAGNGDGHGHGEGQGRGDGGDGHLHGDGHEKEEKKHETFLYFYHPDQVGSTSYVTDGSGEVYEHLEYFSFGETFVQEHSNTDRIPYLFNGKELDEETGLYYYGARYYDPRTSI